MEKASDTLQRIRKLWAELAKTKANTSESEALIEKIRALSAEYEAMKESDKPKESK